MVWLNKVVYIQTMSAITALLMYEDLYYRYTTLFTKLIFCRKDKNLARDSSKFPSHAHKLDIKYVCLKCDRIYNEKSRKSEHFLVCV